MVYYFEISWQADDADFARRVCFDELWAEGGLRWFAARQEPACYYLAADTLWCYSSGRRRRAENISRFWLRRASRYFHMPLYWRYLLLRLHTLASSQFEILWRARYFQRAIWPMHAILYRHDATEIADKIRMSLIRTARPPGVEYARATWPRHMMAMIESMPMRPLRRCRHYHGKARERRHFISTMALCYELAWCAAAISRLGTRCWYALMRMPEGRGHGKLADDDDEKWPISPPDSIRHEMPGIWLIAAGRRCWCFNAKRWAFTAYYYTPY